MALKDIRQRPSLAMGNDKGGNYGVCAFPGTGASPHPDLSSGVGRKGAMSDGERAVGMPVSHAAGHQPAQAAPDHGPHFERELGFNRDGKA